MQWWAEEPMVVVRLKDLEGYRIRILIHEKQAHVAVRVLGTREEVPEWLAELNPRALYPFLICRDLTCHGPALDELMHERWPAPQLLPTEPLKRAQMRLVAAEVRSWYGLRTIDQCARCAELAASCDGELEFFASRDLSVVDIAIAPLLYVAQHIGYRFTRGSPFACYALRMAKRATFATLSQPQMECAEMRA